MNKQQAVPNIEMQPEGRESTAIGVREILVCTGGGCLASGARAVLEALDASLAAHGLTGVPLRSGSESNGTNGRRTPASEGLDATGAVRCVATGCLGPCAKGPVVMINPDRVVYENLRPEDAERIVVSHVIGGAVSFKLTPPHPPDGRGARPGGGIALLEGPQKNCPPNSGKDNPLPIAGHPPLEG